MSVSATASNFLSNYNNQSLVNSTKQPQQELFQLGQDLQSGDLSAAQSDLAAMEQLMPEYTSAAGTPRNSPITNAFNRLSQDLQAGNLAAAQKDYATLQVNLQNPAAQRLSRRFSPAYASENPQPTGIGYLTPLQTYQVIQQEFQQLHPNPGTMGLGLLTPLQTYTFIQNELQQFHAGAQAYVDQNSTLPGSSGLSVLG